MDATVNRLTAISLTVYSLPFPATRLFVEDTYYSDTPICIGQPGGNAQTIGDHFVDASTLARVAHR
jgi:lycopene beta-cyclase